MLLKVTHFLLPTPFFYQIVIQFHFQEHYSKTLLLEFFRISEHFRLQMFGSQFKTAKFSKTLHLLENRWANFSGMLHLKTLPTLIVAFEITD